MKPLLLALSVVALVTVGGPQARGDQAMPVYTGEEFQALYDYAFGNILDHITPPGEPPSITGDRDLDDRIWDMAVERGYELRPTADESGLVSIDGVLMQAPAAEAWKALRTEARANGYSFVVSSAYRSISTQRSWFLTHLEGTSDLAIDATLRWYSVPGTSKHHSGYALDFRYRNGTFGEFRSTSDYAWLAANNFAVPKRFGFIPSYPDDVADQGPNPEPWEFVWVGADLIRCGVPLDLSASPYATSYRWLDPADAACPGGLTITELDSMLRDRGPKIFVMLSG